MFEATIQDGENGLTLSIAKWSLFGGQEEPFMSHTFECWSPIRYIAAGTKDGQTATWIWSDFSTFVTNGSYEYFKPRKIGGVFDGTHFSKTSL